MDMMRMDTNGKNLVCKTCLERKPVENQAQVKTSPTGKSQKRQESYVKDYFCKECKYNFSRAAHLAISTCPYCGASGSIMTKGNTARIIADASKIKADF